MDAGDDHFALCNDGLRGGQIGFAGVGANDLVAGRVFVSEQIQIVTLYRNVGDSVVEIGDLAPWRVGLAERFNGGDVVSTVGRHASIQDADGIARALRDAYRCDEAGIDVNRRHDAGAKFRLVWLGIGPEDMQVGAEVLPDFFWRR